MTVLATIIVLGVLIFVHELGHFWAAKAVGIRVERFSIGLGPRVLGFTSGDTEYVLSAIPLGGYVKMGGMDDAVMESIEGGEVEPREPSPSDFDAKPIWARTLVISAGVIMNMLFAFAVYTSIAGFWGAREYATTQVGQVRAAYLPDGTESLADLPIGARIVEIGGEPTEPWGQVRDALMYAEPGPLEIRAESPSFRTTIDVPADQQERVYLAVGALSAWAPAEIGAVEPGSPADRAGIEQGDRILAVGEVAISNWYDLVREIRARPDQATTVRIDRGGGQLERSVTPNAQTETDPLTQETRSVGAIGVYIPPTDTVYERVGWADAIRYGWNETVAVTGMILGFLRDLVTGNISPRSMGSIVTIGEASGQAAQLGITAFLRFMALFSVNLAVLNLLPIPVLDGGHLVFLGIEAVKGSPVSIEQRLRWSNVGFFVIMGLMVWALGNDLLRLFGL